MIFIPIILAAIVAAVIAASVVRHFAIKEIDYLLGGNDYLENLIDAMIDQLVDSYGVNNAKTIYHNSVKTVLNSVGVPAEYMSNVENEVDFIFASKGYLPEKSAYDI